MLNMLLSDHSLIVYSSNTETKRTQECYSPTRNCSPIYLHCLCVFFSWLYYLESLTLQSEISLHESTTVFHHTNMVEISFNFVILVCISLITWYLLYQGLSSRHQSLSNKIILVTGCDTGFGNTLAKVLDTKGSIVFATCLVSSTAKKLNEETSDRVHVLMMDVTDSNSISEAVKAVSTHCQQVKLPLWGIVNNAGICDK